MKYPAETRAAQVQKILLALWVVLFYLFTYTFLHEGGHAIAILLTGGKITEFNTRFLDLSAHVGSSGSFTQAQMLFQTASGVALPALVMLVFLLVAPKNAHPMLTILKWAGSAGVLATFLVWVASPFFYLAGAPLNDDSTSFLVRSGIPPILLTAVFLLLFAGGLALLLKRTGGLRSTVTLLQAPEVEWFDRIGRRVLGTTAALFILFGLIAFSANGFRLPGPRGPRGDQPPAGYRLVQTIDLSEVERTNEAVLTFQVEQPRAAGIFMLIRDINTPYFDSRLVGPSLNEVLIHGEGYSTGFDACAYEKTLQPGEYRLVITNKKSPGKVFVYQKE